MRILGFNFGEKSFSPLSTSEDNIIFGQDAIPTVRPELKTVNIPDNKKPANIPTVRSGVLSYSSLNNTRGVFSQSDYDLAIINRIEDTDSYVHQAFVKKTGLMFKEGYELVGPDPKTIQYIKHRLAQIGRATGSSFEDLLRSIGSSLIKKSNAFLLKARKEEASGGRRRIVPGTDKELEPIAGYFLIPAETMMYEADKYGKVLRWKQELPNGNFKYFKPDDIVHLHFNRKDGFIYGTPTIVPVVDDIRSLRKIEENVELLIYQHLFPLFHYKIGTDAMPATINEQGNDEIEVARQEIRYMPSEGGLVTSHRHEIKLIGAENSALRAENYLEHFKKRVFSGLGISAVDMGEGECYSEDTETLTENGWKFHHQIDHLKEKIATFNPSTNQIEFHIANYKHESHYKGLMYRFNNNLQYDILVTPKHDMWLGNVGVIGTWDKIHAEDLAAKEKIRALVRLAAPFQELETADPVPEELQESWSILAGAVFATGKLQKKNIVLRTCRSKDKIDPVLSAMKTLGIPFNIEKDKQYKLISFSSSEYGGSFNEYLQSNKHRVLNAVLQLPISARKYFIDSMLTLGAITKGWKLISHQGYVPHYWFSSEDESINDLAQTIILASGYLGVKKSTIRQGKRISYINIRYAPGQQLSLLRKEFISTEEYDGTIYCYNVPNHLFLTRRNGLVTVQGNTANRATSDNMSRNLVDSVKDIQRVIESQFSELIVNELLLESTFGQDVLNDEYKVQLKFKEIDLDYQIKKENHYADLFTKNVLSHHEARIGQGRQPMRMPTVEEIDSDPEVSTKYPEWYGTYWKLIDEPKALIQAMDEPYSAAAVTAAENKSTEVSSSSMTTASEEQKAHEVSLEKEKGKAKVAIAKLKPKPKSRDSFMGQKYNMFENDAIRMISNNTYSADWFKQIGFMVEDSMARELKTKCMSSFASGYFSVNQNTEQQINATIRSRPKIESRVDFYINRVIKQTIEAVKRQNIDSLEKDDKIQKVKAAFDALSFRNDFIEDVELKKAFNLGIIEASKDLKKDSWTIDVPDDACASCKNFSSRVFNLNDVIDLDQIPPLHAHSRSKVKIL
jgi:hypothetical protein